MNFTELSDYEKNNFIKFCVMELHIGEEIEKKFQESGLKIDAFAGLINTGVRNVYSIFRRKDINAELLKSISLALDFNFFSLYQDQLPNQLVHEPQGLYKHDKRISLSLTITSDPETYYNEFPKLLRQILTEAAKHGFQIS